MLKAVNSGASHDDDFFADEDASRNVEVDQNNPQHRNNEKWKLMVIDDDEVIHNVTSMVLDDFTFLGRGLEIINGYSGKDANSLMREHPDTAVLLLDVVMETDRAGLDAVQYIREELNNQFVRIILRTGQPGFAPEHEVISRYDINDYKEKTELTALKLNTTVIASLRAYQGIKTIHELTMSNDTLERCVRERTSELVSVNKNLQKEIEEHERDNKALRESKQRLAEAQRIANMGNWEWDLKSGEMSWSEQTYRIFNLDPQNTPVTFDVFVSAVNGEDRQGVKNAINMALQQKNEYVVEHRMECDDMATRYMRQQGRVYCDAESVAVRMAGTIQDVTEQHIAEQKMRKLSSAIEQTADAVMITDRKGIIEYVNPAFVDMTGYNKQDAVGNTPNLLRSGKQSEAFNKRLWTTILRGEVFSDVVINKKSNGTFYYEEKTITPLKDSNGNITHFISTGKDITDRMAAQERLHHLAHHDALTGLPNRTLLQDRLMQVLARTRWNQRNIAVLFLDIDRFKVINDTLGHGVGDHLLRGVSQRLLDCVREGDTVARLGGDEFAIILNDIASQNDVEPIANKILNALANPFVATDREFFITTSIGISLYPADGDDTMTLLKKADVAMYHAKESGRNNYKFYTEEDDAKAIERLSLEMALRRALERNEFFLHYQPQLDLVTGKTVAMEALLRWCHSEFQIVSPFHFVPLLEDTGMIEPVGEWVLRTACLREKTRQESGLNPLRVAVNVSVRQFQHKGLAKKIEGILNETGLQPQYLELEVTEGLLIEHISDVAGTLRQLHDMGIHLSIDDFGTGYCSMNYLKRLPFDTLKIDRSFVHDIGKNADDAAIVSAIIALAHNMNMKVVAEGVENDEQLDFLRQQGCDIIQGFLHSPPLPPEAIDMLEIRGKE